MKVLVHGASLAGARRMGLAALGLALRGHHVVWLGPGVPEPLVASGIVEQFQGRPLWLRQRADLVLGGPRRPLRIAANGWCAGVHAMVLDLELEALRRWTLSDRWAWGSLDSAGMLDPGAGGIEDVLGVPAGLMGRWSFEPPPEAPDASHPDTEALERTCERWVARREGCAPRAAAFLDRDGTLVVEKGYLAHADDLELLETVPHGLARLKDAGFALVVISNQSGVGRGFFPLSRVYEAMARLRRELRAQEVELDAVYFCPHRPEADCDCRKPRAGLLRQAALNLNLALRRSAVIGDKRLDVETGHGVGALGILVRTGYGRDEEERAEPSGKRGPDFVAEDLGQAAEWLAARAGVSD